METLSINKDFISLFIFVIIFLGSGFMNNYKELAEILYPNIDMTIEYYEKLYLKIDIKEED